MAVEYPVLIRSFVAARDLSTCQYFPVKMSGNYVDRCSAVTARVIGILQNKPSANESADVMLIGVSKVQASNTALATGAFLGVNATSGTCKAVTPASGTSNMIFGHVVAACTGSSIGSAFIVGLPWSSI